MDGVNHLEMGEHQQTNLTLRESYTGKMFWDLLPPGNEVYQKYGGIRAIPAANDSEKGKIIACTYSNCYCYEAER